VARGLFVGLMTLDCLYRVDHVPASNEKLVAQDCLLLAGGPATNAAVTFAHLGQQATVMAALGRHPLAELIKAELSQYGVAIAPLLSDSTDLPPLSTSLITITTGERAVVSRNAVGRQATPEAGLASALDNIDIVLIDGHQMAVGQTLAAAARQRGLPVVIDAGSWKPGFEALLPLATHAICSANFYPPGCGSHVEVLTYLKQLDIPHVAMTRGPEPILYNQRESWQALPVPQGPVVDTLAAGDILHGAFCHYGLSQPWPRALTLAAQVASHACRYVGPRAWMQHPLKIE